MLIEQQKNVLLRFKHHWNHLLLNITNKDNISLDSLLQELQAGHESAYVLLLNEFEAPIYRFFYYAHKNHPLAQDQSNETFMRFVKGVHRIENHETQGVKSYLWGVANNVLRENWRKKSVAISNEVPCEEISGDSNGVDHHVSVSEELNLAIIAINQFSEPKRQILLLRFVESYKLEEIATMMSLPLNSIKSYIHRGRKQLCQQFNISKD